MHYSTKEFALFTFSAIVILHIYLFKDEIQLYMIQQYNRTIISMFNLQHSLLIRQDDSITFGLICTIISVLLLIISGLYITYKVFMWILHNLCDVVYYQKLIDLFQMIFMSIFSKFKLIIPHNEHVKLE
ncbi:unnamed protein product [Schistosoma turkestanicum]|nr:unnamed protein product [Schistosoma turkestanicum]